MTGRRREPFRQAQSETRTPSWSTSNARIRRMDLVLEETRSDPRFGTTTYQLTNIGQSPSAALFTPDPSFTQVQGRAFGRHGQAKPAPPAAQD